VTLTNRSVSAAEPLTGAAVGGCTPLTTAGANELLSDKYQPSGTWYAVPGVNGQGFVIGGVVTPSPTGKLEMAAYTVPSFGRRGFRRCAHSQSCRRLCYRRGGRRQT